MGAPPETFDVFLSHNSQDRAAVERISERLRAAGLSPWLDKWALVPGGDWQQELGAGLESSATCAVFIGPDDLGAWELQEVALAVDRAATDRGFRVFPVLLPGVREPFDPNRLPHFLRTRTWVDFRRGADDRRGLQDLVNAIKGVPFGPDAVLPHSHDVCPYRGMDVFDVEHAEFYFGRDGEIQRLLELLKLDRFLAVLGPSGSGKSSLVRAGLVPPLLRGTLGGRWRSFVVRPGASPLTALAVAVSDGGAAPATLDGLHADPRSLHLALAQMVGPDSPDDRVLIVVDQLEEVFTLCRDEGERKALFSNLIHAASAPGGAGVVVVTMRSDFYSRCVPYPELAQLVSGRQLLVGPMARDGLRQAIEEPARRVGLELEQGLIDTILDDAGSDSGSLPLLEYALLELWERRRGTMLTLEGYRDAGGVRGAVAKRADELVDGFTSRELEVARRTLLRLTQPGEGTEDTRRRAPLSELSGAEVSPVLDRLVAARLLTTSSERGEPQLEVSHEALIRAWPRLRAWVDTDRDGLRLHRQLTDAAREWERLGRDDDALYRGARLAEAQEFVAPDVLNALERAFLTASVAQAEREHGEREAQQRRARRRLVATAAGLFVVLVIVSALGFEARLQARHATDQRDTAQATQLATQALAGLNDDPGQALTLAVRAYNTRHTGLSEAALRVAAGEATPETVLRAGAENVNEAAFADDQRHVASAADDGTVRIFDWRAPHARPIVLRTGQRYVNGVTFAGDHRHLAGAGDDGTIRLYDWRDPHSRPIILRAGPEPVNGVAFADDGRHVASAGEDGTVRIFNWRAPRTPATVLHASAGTLNAVAFAGDGRHLASAALDGGLRVYDWRAPRNPPIILHTGSDSVNDVAFAGDQRHLAAAEGDTVRIYDLHAPRRRPVILHTGQRSVSGLAFASDQHHLASAGYDGTVRIFDWRAPRTAPIIVRTGQINVNSVEFAGDERHLVSAGADGTVRVFDWRAQAVPRTVLRTGQPSVTGVAFGGDRYLATSGQDGTVRIFDRQAPGTPPTVLRAQRRGSDSGLTRLVYLLTRGGLNGVAFARDQRHLAVAAADGSVQIFDRRAPHAPPIVLRAGSEPVDGVAFAPDGRHVASAGDDGSVRIFDWRSPDTPAIVLHTGQEAAYAVAFAGDGRHLASAGLDGTVRIYDWRAPHSQPVVLHTTQGIVNDVAFAGDRRHLASAGQDGTVRIYDWRAPRAPATILRGQSDVNEVAFAGDELAGSSDDGTVRIFDWRNPQAPQTILRAGRRPFAVAFAPDHQHLAVSGDHGTLSVWDCERCGTIRGVLALARRRLPRTSR